MYLKRVTTLAIILVLASAPAAWAHAAFQTQADQDAIFKQIGVDEKRGTQVPLNAAFKDQTGRDVSLADYFGDGKPVLLSLNYYECPMLCPVTFANLARTMDEMKGLKPGKDFRVLVVSISPYENAGIAKAKADETYRMLKGYEDPSAWWPFLYGDERDIEAVTRAVGFRYKIIDKTNIAHPSVLIVLTPEGKVSRYLYGIEHSPQDLRLALIEASKGEIGTSAALNRVLLFCYHYDPVGKKYVLAAARIMTGAAAIVFISLLILILFMWKSERARGRK